MVEDRDTLWSALDLCLHPHPYTHRVCRLILFLLILTLLISLCHFSSSERGRWLTFFARCSWVQGSSSWLRRLRSAHVSSVIAEAPTEAFILCHYSFIQLQIWMRFTLRNTARPSAAVAWEQNTLHRKKPLTKSSVSHTCNTNTIIFNDPPPSVFVFRLM